MTSLAHPLLTDHQHAVVGAFLDELSPSRRHVVVSLSGAHAYGFPSPDSDLDVKAVHLDPTTTLLGFPRKASAAERLETIQGVEVDYSSNELGAVLLGVIKGNGNYLERFLSGYTLAESEWLNGLKPLVQGSLSRRVHRHYAGFAAQQRLEWTKSGGRSAKKLLYVLRTTLTGTHLLRTGELVTDVTRLLERYGFGEAQELVERKRQGERTELPPEVADRWIDRIPGAFALLDAAAAESVLPPSPPNVDDLEAWLVSTRRALLD